MSSATFLWFSNPSLTCSYRGGRKSLSDNFYFRRPQRKNNGPEFLKTLQSVPCPAKMMLNYTIPWLPTITAEKIWFLFLTMRGRGQTFVLRCLQQKWSRTKSPLWWFVLNLNIPVVGVNRTVSSLFLSESTEIICYKPRSFLTLQ